MSHFPQLEFKFEPLNILSGVVILWTHIFNVHLYSMPTLIFIMKIDLWKKVRVTTYVSLFLKGKKKEIKP